MKITWASYSRLSRKPLARLQFVNAISALNTVEDVQGAFKEKGVDISIEQLNTLREQGIAASTELNSSQLENIAGGVDADMEEDAFVITGTLVLKGISALTGGTAFGAILGRLF